MGVKRTSEAFAWTDCEFSDLCTLQRGFDITQATRRVGEVPVFSSSGLSYWHDKAKLIPPAVITGRKGLLGKVFYVEVPCWPHDTTLWVKDFKGNHPKFVAYFLDAFQLERFDAATSVPTLNRNNLTKIPIKLPHFEEQRAIAEALSDVDALIEALDGMIAKKRDLRKAALQQLITGKTRLPGFKGKWETTRLGDVVDIRSGGTPSTTNSDYWNGSIPWCTPTDITALQGRKHLSTTTRSISERGLRSSSAELLPARSLIMTSRATIGECAINTIPVTTNQGFKNLVPDDNVSVDFLYYLMATQKEGLKALCGGSTFLEIGKKQLDRYMVTLPIDPDEQTEIASVLSDIDAEIERFEQRLDKTSALKQGMMQELLTGKTRLV